LLSQEKELYFLTQDGKLVKIKSIRKIPYSCRIYKGGLYEIELENGDKFLVSPEHRVYSLFPPNQHLEQFPWRIHFNPFNFPQIRITGKRAV